VTGAIRPSEPHSGVQRVAHARFADALRDHLAVDRHLHLRDAKVDIAPTHRVITDDERSEARVVGDRVDDRDVPIGDA